MAFAEELEAWSNESRVRGIDMIAELQKEVASLNAEVTELKRKLRKQNRAKK